MHPYLIEQVAAAHTADLRREALANCYAKLIARIGLHDQLTAIIGRLTAAFARPARTSRTSPVCCPA